MSNCQHLQLYPESFLWPLESAMSILGADWKCQGINTPILTLTPLSFGGISLRLIFHTDFQGSQFDYVPVAFSGSLLDNEPFLAFFFSCIVSLLSFQGLWDYLPNKYLALKSLSQGLLLREPKLKHPAMFQTENAWSGC